VQKTPRIPPSPQEPDQEPRQPDAEPAQRDPTPLDQAASAPPESAAEDQQSAQHAEDEAPTTPLKESIARARQILAARKNGASGALPAITPEVSRSPQQTNGSHRDESAGFSQRLRERLRASAGHAPGDDAGDIAKDMPKPDTQNGQALPATLALADESAPPLAATLEPPPEAATEAAPVAEEHADQPPQESRPADTQDVPAERRLEGANGVGKHPAASNGKPRITGKMTVVLAPSRTGRLPETEETLRAEAANGEITEDGERPRGLAAVTAALALRPRTEPLPAIGISREGLLNEEARRERSRRVRTDATRRWRRRRRYAFYVMSYQRRRQERHNTLVRRALTSAVSLVGLIILVVIGYTLNDAYMYFNSQSAALASLPYVTSRDNAEIFDSKGNLLFKITADGVKHYIPLSQMSINVINATIATEDKDFWINQGVDFTAIVRAAQADLNAGGATQGGSTITQQLIKNTVTGGDDTLDRKIREAILAVGITQQYSKKQILEMYLNSIGYGENAYGVDAAALEYFDLPDKGNVTGASQLDLAQASMLAGLPKNPNLFDPFLNLKIALDRQKVVLQAMAEQGYISQDEAKQAEAEAAQPGFLHAPPQESNLAPHFVYWIEDQLANMVDSGKLPLSLTGLRIYTTLDLELQNKVQKILKQQIRNLTNSGQDVNNGAAVIIDQHTGAVLVMLGSADYYNKAIRGYNNVATQSFREVGSSFKPITYATAFEKGWFPAMPIYDGPTAFPYSTSFGYKPLDYSRTFTGQQTVRTALQQSLNVPAVKALEFAGVDDTLNMAERLGITAYKGTPGLSMTLGSLDIHMIDLVSAYSTFANYGVRNPPFGIWRITDQTGKTIYQYTPHGEQVVSPQISFLITNVLSDNASRAQEFGSCSPLYLETASDCYAGKPARPAAAKTGTTEDFRDDLTMGYTMDYTMGVWVGNTDDHPTNEANGIVGAAPIWNAAMLAAEAGHPFVNFPVPPGVEKDYYCGNGRCSTDWFITGAVPQGAVGNSGQKVPCLKVQTRSDGNNWTVSCPPPKKKPGDGGGGGGGGGGLPPTPAISSDGALYGPQSQAVPPSLPEQGKLPQQQGLVTQDINLERPVLFR
jgi:membrane peptidoglycan carboxypeptidase